MPSKGIYVIVSILIAMIGLVAAYSITEYPADNSKVVSVYSEGPIELGELIMNIENYSYYQGYDNDTLNWMKTLGKKQVFSGNGTFVIMDSNDADKIPSVYATDVFIIENFKCHVLENHSLGNMKYPRDVLLVGDVEYMGEKIIDIPGGGA